MLPLVPYTKVLFTLGDTNLREAAHMRQRHAVAKAHIQLSVHNVWLGADQKIVARKIASVDRDTCIPRGARKPNDSWLKRLQERG